MWSACPQILSSLDAPFPSISSRKVFLTLLSLNSTRKRCFELHVRTLTSEEAPSPSSRFSWRLFAWECKDALIWAHGSSAICSGWTTSHWDLLNWSMMRVTKKLSWLNIWRRTCSMHITTTRMASLWVSCSMHRLKWIQTAPMILLCELRVRHSRWTTTWMRTTLWRSLITRAPPLTLALSQRSWLLRMMWIALHQASTPLLL